MRTCNQIMETYIVLFVLLLNDYNTLVYTKYILKMYHNKLLILSI